MNDSWNWQADNLDRYRMNDVKGRQMQIEVVNPSRDPRWDDKLHAFDQATIFHTSDWARVIQRAYGYATVYLLGNSNGNRMALMPLFHINSVLTGRRGVSLPFTDQCAPLFSDDSSGDRLIEKAVAIGQHKKWRSLEIRGGEYFLQKQIVPSDIFYTHQLDLAGDEQTVQAKFRSSTRRNIKKAVKADLQPSISHTFSDVDAFYQLNCLTRRDHGLPPQPLSFFRHLYDVLIEKRKGFVVLVRHKGKVIAGAVYLLYRDQCMYKYGASDKRYQNLRANNLVMWSAIQWCIQNQFRRFHFGRTELQHEGLLQFKRGWGTTEQKAYYYKYNFKSQDFEARPARIKSSYFVFERLPIPILTLIGRLLYRHVG